jgi:hypothetical protein
VSVPSSESGPPHPLSRKRVCSPTPSPVTNGGGDTHSPAGEGAGGSQFGLLEKMPSTLSTLCGLAGFPCITSKRKNDSKNHCLLYLKGQCHEINNLFEGLRNQVSTFCRRFFNFFASLLFIESTDLILNF